MTVRAPSWASPCIGAPPPQHGITQALGNLGWLYAPGSCIKDPAGDISIFNERAGPRADAGCGVAFIRAARSGDGRVAQTEEGSKVRRACWMSGRHNISSQPTSCCFKSWHYFYSSSLHNLLPFDLKRHQKDLNLLIFCSLKPC